MPSLKLPPRQFLGNPTGCRLPAAILAWTGAGEELHQCHAGLEIGWVFR